jgi:cytochrome c oxidase cbb3-type subunit 4
MTLDIIFSHASSVMTVISLAIFVGILWWAFSRKRKSDFDTAAHIPFDDDDDNEGGDGGDKPSKKNSGEARNV